MSPNRSRDELLGDVVHRGERLRRRRRIGLSLGSGLAALLAVAGVASVVGTGGESSTQLAAGSRPTTSTPPATAPATGGTVFAVDQPSTSVAEVPPATTVDTLPGTSTTAYQPGSEPTGVAATTTTVPPAVERPPCGPAQLTATLSLAPSYKVGAPVSGPAVLRNTSGAVCWYVSYTSSRSIVDAGGNPMTFGSALIADAFADTPFGPGETLHGAVDWDQKVCVADPSCPQAPAGTYTASVTWDFEGTPIVASATFLIVP